jgi:hypothetical protein
LVAAGIASIAGAIGFMWWWGYTAEGRALRALPDAERLPLFHRTLETLHQMCDPAPPRSLRALCRDHARLVLELRECDPRCRETARRLLSTPMR